MSTQRDSSSASPSPPPPPARSTSPDSVCAICLGDLVNKSGTNSCMHKFCFHCIREWSNTKAECPLCKRTFSKIFHTFESKNVYREHVLQPEDAGQSSGIADLLFGINNIVEQPSPSRSIQSPSQLGMELSDRLAVPGWFLTRQQVYIRNLWALPLLHRSRELTVRESTPQFYRSNPSERDRLVPWLLREFNAISRSDYATYLDFLREVLEGILMYSIRSHEFISRMRPYFAENTSHFVHEFYSFAIAPINDVLSYDREVLYMLLTSILQNDTNPEIYINITPSYQRQRQATGSSQFNDAVPTSPVSNASPMTELSPASSTDVNMPGTPYDCSPYVTDSDDTLSPMSHSPIVNVRVELEDEMDTLPERTIGEEPIAGPSGLSITSQNFDESSSGEEYPVGRSSQMKKKRKNRVERLNSFKKLRQSWSTTDDSDSDN